MQLVALFNYVLLKRAGRLLACGLPLINKHDSLNVNLLTLLLPLGDSGLTLRFQILQRHSSSFCNSFLCNLSQWLVSVVRRSKGGVNLNRTSSYAWYGAVNVPSP